MGNKSQTLEHEEQSLYEQEHALIEMEAQIHAQEDGLLNMERSFDKRNQTLSSLASYVADQEKSLLERASSIGPKAKKLVADRLGSGHSSSLEGGVVGALDDRQAVIEKRRELLAARMELIEEREAIYAKRLEAIEGAETGFTDFEQALMAREKVITDTLRELITGAAELAGDDDGEGDDDSEADPAVAKRARAPTQELASPRKAKKAKKDAEGGLDVEAGETSGARRTRRSGSPSVAEDDATRRRKGRVKMGTNQFRITLEAVLGKSEKHQFFRYEDDEPDDLPGLFLATPNLLKEGREVRLRITLGGEQVETTGVVSWRRHADENDGPPGMGIELTELTEAQCESVDAWMEDHKPMVV